MQDAEPNFALHLAGTPDDLVAPLWALQNTGQMLENGEAGVAGADIDATGAWQLTHGSRRIVVGLVDTGVMMSHPDLAANLWSAPRSFTVTIAGATMTCPAGSHGFNAVNRTCDPADDHGHGTHVAGSIGAVGNNGTGVVGVNWTASMMALKFIDADGIGYVSDVINALEFAMQVKEAFASDGEADIRILNNSWTGGTYSQALSDTITRTGEAGMLFVVAAGNGAVDHASAVVFPSDYEGANVLSVAATDYRDRLAAFSDYGVRHVHVAAPGALIYSTVLSAADGVGAVGAYGSRSGTSMAAAYTSGVAALVLSRCDLSVGALRDTLLRTAERIPALDGRVESGARIDASAAVRSCDAATSSREIVIRASDVPAHDRHGGWVLQTQPGAADGVALTTTDHGWASTDRPLSGPSDYFDVRFAPEPGVPYRIWLRMRAEHDSKWNDSVWLQFSDARVNGAPSYRINAPEGLAINLEPCSNCGTAGWGWQDGAYWLAKPAVVFGSAAAQTMRVQTREDGVAIDQIVVSASTWVSSPPGQPLLDSTIVPRGGGVSTSGSTPTSGAGMPFGGVPAALPGLVQAEHFDMGGEGVGYHDTDPINSGGALRSEGVDLQPTIDGGYNVGWMAPGEWLAYTVSVAAAGAYTAEFRVAALGPGGQFHLELGGADVTGPLTIPDTGGWQSWRVLSTSVTLPAGPHLAKLVMDRPGAIAVGNVDWFSIAEENHTSTAPGRLLAVQFDEGGEGVAYHDDSPGNSGGALRSSDVDIEGCAEGGHNVGWIAAGEWLRYSVTVSSTGPYAMQFRVASPFTGGVLHVESGGADLTGPVTVPYTGGWQAWTTVSVPVNLVAGQQAFRVVFDTRGFNLRHVDIVAR